MYVQVRTVEGLNYLVTDISKTMQIYDFKLRLENVCGKKRDKVRLFFKGKQMEDEYTLHDYRVNQNDVIQAMDKPNLNEFDNQSVKPGTSKSPRKSTSGTSSPKSIYFKIGDFVDMRDAEYGAWFEGKIVEINNDPEFKEIKGKNKDKSESSVITDRFLYKVKLVSDNSSSNVRLKDIRPRARRTLQLSQLHVGDMVMVNHNMEEPKKRGYWYDFTIKEIKVKGRKEVIGDLFIGRNQTPVKDRTIIFINEIMQIEKIQKLGERNESEVSIEPAYRQTGDTTADFCDRCVANPKRKCKECGCNVCGLKINPDKQIMCDECDYSYHIWCLRPPLDKVPEDDEWYCPTCKNDDTEIVKAGEKLKESKTKSKRASAVNEQTRDWGKGMACVGRSKECTIVPSNHFGPIPGVEVGTEWKFRVQVSESGVHRPHVAGIHGREGHGAYSIVLSGGYEADYDTGEEFAYTGCGGRDLSGNKRTAVQSSDQTLTRMNKALALNCNAPLNTKKGAESANWRLGKPVRVIRNYKLGKYSRYAPEDGNRYDGIYKLFKYYPEKGKSGFIVWRYLFRRDDPIPPPWTKEGKKRIESLGLEMIYPDGYLEALEAKKNSGETSAKGKKRSVENNAETKVATKKQKVEKYKLTAQVEKLIAKDKLNKKLWTTCKDQLKSGRPKFLASVEEVFTCICCMELIWKPVTLTCSHNVCFECIKRSFTADIKTCPHCREPVTDYNEINKNLQQVLLLLFPGYTAGRK